jgi:hypothetical protein
MLSIPPYILLFVFGAFLAGFLFFAVANIVLLARFGARNAFGLGASFIFICITSLILFLTWQSLGGIDWKTPVPIVSFPAGTI